MDKYAELRAALEQTCHALLIDDPDMIRALLAERDALREALEAMMDYAGQPISHPAAQLARAALARGET